jgi:glycosyltransferase involved in cell wall biosynthesis
MSKKIALLDSWKLKFAQPIKEHWESLGHTVLVNPLWSEVSEADLIYFYQSDNQLVEFTTQKMTHRGKVYAGVIDIEAWANQPQTADWSQVDGVTFIAEHIRDMVLPHIAPPPKVSLIKPGINLEKYPLRPPNDTESRPVRRIAYVVGDKRIWDVKRFDIALMMLRDLLDSTKFIWQLHVLGSYSTHEQYNDYCQHLIENLQLENFVIWYERQESVSKWLDDKDFFLLPSTKEAFSYATAEAMAKGIKPILGNWRSADVNWEPFYCKTIGQMFSKFLESDYDPRKYRQFIVDNYDEKRYLRQLDEFLEIS